MRAVLAPVAALLLTPLAEAASISQVAFEVQNFTKDDNFAELTIKVTNKGPGDLKHAFIECGFLDKSDKALDVGQAIASNLASGAAGYVQVTVQASPRIEKAECRVSQVAE